MGEESLLLKKPHYRILKGRKEGKALTVKEIKVSQKVIQKSNRILIK